MLSLSLKATKRSEGGGTFIPFSRPVTAHFLHDPRFDGDGGTVEVSVVRLALSPHCPRSPVEDSRPRR